MKPNPQRAGDPHGAGRIPRALVLATTVAAISFSTRQVVAKPVGLMGPPPTEMHAAPGTAGHPSASLHQTHTRPAQNRGLLLRPLRAIGRLFRRDRGGNDPRVKLEKLHQVLDQLETTHAKLETRGRFSLSAMVLKWKQQRRQNTALKILEIPTAKTAGNWTGAREILTAGADPQALVEILQRLQASGVPHDLLQPPADLLLEDSVRNTAPGEIPQIPAANDSDDGSPVEHLPRKQA